MFGKNIILSKLSDEPEFYSVSILSGEKFLKLLEPNQDIVIKSKVNGCEEGWKEVGECRL